MALDPTIRATRSSMTMSVTCREHPPVCITLRHSAKAQLFLLSCLGKGDSFAKQLIQSLLLAKVSRVPSAKRFLRQEASTPAMLCAGHSGSDRLLALLVPNGPIAANPCSDTNGWITPAAVAIRWTCWNSVHGSFSSTMYLPIYLDSLNYTKLSCV